MLICLLCTFICVFILHDVISYSMLPNKRVFHSISRLIAMNMKQRGVFVTPSDNIISHSDPCSVTILVPKRIPHCHVKVKLPKTSWNGEGDRRYSGAK